MRIYDIIEKKRDKLELSYDEIKYFVNGFLKEEIPDYQASALLMAIYINGMSKSETYNLTKIMTDSGDKIDLSVIPGIKVDKHSTGGVGDKTTQIVAPIVAACGVPVAKMSGKGLGFTGGTIDKFSSVPGFKTALSKEEFINNVKEIGIAVVGQTGDLAPADKKLYALRDVTATVSSMPLIASSIMSKKLALGADCIVLDVKTGSGAFMKTLEDSILLAQSMVDIGVRADKRMSAVISDMNVPLGNAIGNSLEMIEAIDVLKGKGPEDITLVSIFLAAKMLELAGVGSFDECRQKAIAVIKSGAALQKFKELIIKQCGNAEIIVDKNLFGVSEYKYELLSDYEGYVEAIKVNSIGRASVILGAGRETKESIIDYTAGIEFFIKPGMKVKKGDVIAVLYSSAPEKIEEAAKLIKASFKLSKTATKKHTLIYAVVDSKGVNYLI